MKTIHIIKAFTIRLVSIRLVDSLEHMFYNHRAARVFVGVLPAFS